MAEVGILAPTERVELIRGEIVEMPPRGRRHIAFVNNLTRLLVVELGDRAIVSVQNPVVLSEDTEPQPDLAVLRRRAPSYMEREPFADDLLLLVEVADTSLRYGRTTKLRLHAAAGIPEYWVVDCETESIEVHRAPSGDGYRELSRVSGAGSVSVQAIPEVTLPLREIFA